MGFLDNLKDGLEAYQASQEKQRSRPASPAPASQGYNQDSEHPSRYGGGAAAEYYNEAANAGNQPFSGNQSYSQGGLSAGTGNDLYNSVDKNQTIQAASQHSGDQDSSVFASALNHLASPGATPSLDHQAVENAHAEAYRNGNAASLDASGMGSAAAMQAFKLFTSSGKSSSTGGNSQSQLLSLAMGEAVKLFNNSGGPSSGGKQDVVNSATKTAMKLLLQSKMGGSTGGSEGGLGSLLSMASKFM